MARLLISLVLALLLAACVSGPAPEDGAARKPFTAVDDEGGPSEASPRPATPEDEALSTEERARAALLIYELSRSTEAARRHELLEAPGLGGAIVLTLLALTGFYLEFPQVVTQVVSWVSPVRDMSPDEHPQSELQAGAPKIPLEQAIAIARATFPDARPMWVGLPQDERDSYSVGLRQPGEVRQAGGQTEVWIDQYSGSVRRVTDWRRFTGGETFLAWLFPLHNGEAFGLAGRWIVFVTGLTPLILYGTALRMWWLKRIAHQRRRARPERTSQSL